MSARAADWARTPEAWLFAALALFGLAPAVVLYGAGDEFSGSAAPNVSDFMQYMGMIREAGEHGLTSNLFDVVDDPNLYFHPTFFISGLVWKLGASIQFSLLMWNVVGLVALFAGFAAYVRRMLAPKRGAMAVALALALFYLSPATMLTDWLGANPVLQFGTSIVGLEMFAAAYTWGGITGTISIAMMPLFLLGVERLLDPERRREGRSLRWYAAWTGVAGMLSSWLHPWQGLTLLVILGGLALWERPEWRRLLTLAAPVAMTVAPLAYMWALGHTDSSWQYVTQANDLVHVDDWVLLGLAPVLLALPGYRGPAHDTQERVLRIWPIAALVVYFVLQSSWFYHAFTGLSLPLAILAVKGWRELRIPRPAVAGVVLILTAPGVYYVLTELYETRKAHFLTSEERAALDYLDESARPGPVLAPRVPLGEAVPGFTGRNTYVGHYTWTPDHDRRSARADALFGGKLAQAAARRLVRESRAAFLVSDCAERADLRPLLGPMIVRVRRFGCATAYEVSDRRPAATPSRPPQRAGS